MSNQIGLYIHIPFCRHKCPYCDFFSRAAGESEYERYVRILKTKTEYWARRAAALDKTIATVYMGGGTPSVLGARRLCEILREIKRDFTVEQNAEITVELNPDTAKTIDFNALRGCGFNRISMGLQSANPDELAALGRIHTAEDAEISVRRAQAAEFDNISLDLMMGIPRQNAEILKTSIKFCADCGVSHISSYILKIEEGTPFFAQKNTLGLPSEDEQAELYLTAVNELERLGYRQYEISNFAKPGCESRHNTNYWKCGEYIGIGPSAYSFLNGERFHCERSLSDFENDILTRDGTGGDEEEFIMLSLRLASGLGFDEYRQKFGAPLPHAKILKARRFEKLGLLKISDRAISLTPKGFLVSNSIISSLI